MALGSQASTVDLVAALTGLTHDIFVGKVRDNVRRESATAQLFEDASPGEDYRLEGSNMVFAVDLRFKTGALATDGKLPDYVGMDAVQGKITPIRRYERIAMDSMTELRASGDGAFEDFGTRVFDQLWSAWKSMEIRHSIGSSTGLVSKVSSRTSSTVFVLKDGYGNVDTNPIMHLSVDAIIGWYDVSAAGVGGAGKITVLAESTNTVTVTTAGTWEPSAQLAADDLIYFATTPDTTASHFVLEKNLAPNGLGVIVDPNADNTTVFNISQTTYPRHKPYRVASATFDHMELTEHWLQLGAKRGFSVSPQTDVVIAFPSAVAQLARSLMGFQQQAYVGTTLKGGYTGVVVSGIQILEDPFFYHNVAMTLNKDALYRVNLGKDADFWQEDGSKWSRISDYDGKDAYVREYLNFFSNFRGSHGALTGIVTPDITDTAYAPVANY